MDLFHSPSFAIYSVFASALCVLLFVVDSVSGGVRAKTKTTPNKEDLGATAKGATVVDTDPDGVARVMRAHRNAIANIIPFLIVMFLFVALGATPQWVTILCSAFLVGRIGHAVAYISGVQPWRTLSFVVGQACTVIAIVQVVRMAIPLMGA